MGDAADDTANVAVAPALVSQEGIMAKTDFPLNIDRRRLLVELQPFRRRALCPTCSPLTPPLLPPFNLRPLPLKRKPRISARARSLASWKSQGGTVK